ncbi:hypothetical protein BU26DRAFT_228450 [Trematosphaeria pertusa]|uniref:Uncharacterized protein n=1 Tax=Trematosphaeria pertusa TaxID=390896 RepID=A0A6A6ITG7_9PLEO|nr:uncharacterized protein BU26DRAFT_228450 [Trematosphaeria pertusa]KAF2253696.1 hypothetical protein BU26DRAFT_228450 [Trematosphaeria pertusa]
MSIEGIISITQHPPMHLIWLPHPRCTIYGLYPSKAFRSGFPWPEVRRAPHNIHTLTTFDSPLTPAQSHNPSPDLADSPSRSPSAAVPQNYAAPIPTADSRADSHGTDSPLPYQWDAADCVDGFAQGLQMAEGLARSGSAAGLDLGLRIAADLGLHRSQKGYSDRRPDSDAETPSRSLAVLHVPYSSPLLLLYCLVPSSYLDAYPVRTLPY